MTVPQIPTPGDNAWAKFIDTIAAGIGRVSTLFLSGKEAKNEAERILQIEKAKTDAETYKITALSRANAKAEILSEQIKREGQIEINDRIKARLEHQNVNKQINIESIVNKTPGYLPSSVSTEPVEKDWLNKFFRKAEDIADEQMQEIWARVLAGEIAKPKSFSLRTVEIISNLTKQEAENFQLACSLSFSLVKINNEKIAGRNSILFDLEGNIFGPYGFKYGVFLSLHEAGLIGPTQVTIEVANDSNFLELLYGDTLLRINYPTGSRHELTGYSYTTAGQELYPIVEKTYNPDFMDAFINYYKRSGYSITQTQRTT